MAANTPDRLDYQKNVTPPDLKKEVITLVIAHVKRTVAIHPTNKAAAEVLGMDERSVGTYSSLDLDDPLFKTDERRFRWCFAYAQEHDLLPAATIEKLRVRFPAGAPASPPSPLPQPDFESALPPLKRTTTANVGFVYGFQLPGIKAKISGLECDLIKIGLSDNVDSRIGGLLKMWKSNTTDIKEVEFYRSTTTMKSGDEASLRHSLLLLGAIILPSDAIYSFYTHLVQQTVPPSLGKEEYLAVPPPLMASLKLGVLDIHQLSIELSSGSLTPLVHSTLWASVPSTKAKLGPVVKTESKDD